MAILDQGVNLAGEQIDSGQQTDCAIALVLVVAREGRMFAGLRRQVRGGRSKSLNAGLLVTGDDRHRIARLLFRSGRGGLNKPYLAVDAQNLRHLLFELRVTTFQVVAHLVRLYFLPVEYVAQRALGQFGKAAVPLCRALLARMAGEESRRPHFVRIPEFLGLAGEVHNPGLGRGRDRGLLAGPGSIIERRNWTISERPLNTALNGLMVHPDALRHRKKGWVLSVRQQHSRALYLARRFRSRTGNRAQRRQILLANCQFDRLPPRRHELNPLCESKQKA